MIEPSAAAARVETVAPRQPQPEYDCLLFHALVSGFIGSEFPLRQAEALAQMEYQRITGEFQPSSHRRNN